MEVPYSCIRLSDNSLVEGRTDITSVRGGSSDGVCGMCPTSRDDVLRLGTLIASLKLRPNKTLWDFEDAVSLEFDIAVALEVAEKFVDGRNALGWDDQKCDITLALASTVGAMRVLMSESEIRSKWMQSLESRRETVYRGYLKQVNKRRKIKVTMFALLNSPRHADLRKKFERRFMKSSENQLQGYLEAVRKINANEVRAFRQNGRCYSEISSLPKFIRERIEFLVNGVWEPSCELDISASFLCIVASNVRDSAERSNLIDAAKEGRLYDVLREGIEANGCQLSDLEKNDKSRFKKTLQALVMFTHYASPKRRSMRIALEKAFPGFMESLRSLYDRRTPRQVNAILSRIEGRIVLDRVCKAMWERGHACYPLHDSVIVGQSLADEATEVLRDACFDVLGFCPLIKRK